MTENSDRFLTDTHSLVWALQDPDQLSKKARSALETRQIVCSVVNLWELMLKRNRPDSPVPDPRSWWLQFVVPFALSTIPVRAAHILKLPDLPEIHRDPFDRMLAAQAIVEDLPIISKDSKLKRYGIRIIW